MLPQTSVFSSNDWGSSDDDNSSDSSTERFKPTRRGPPARRGRRPARQAARAPKRGGRGRRKAHSSDTDISDSDDDEDMRRNSNRRSSQKVRYIALHIIWVFDCELWADFLNKYTLWLRSKQDSGKGSAMYLKNTSEL